MNTIVKTAMSTKTKVVLGVTIAIVAAGTALSVLPYTQKSSSARGFTVTITSPLNPILRQGVTNLLADIDVKHDGPPQESYTLSSITLKGCESQPECSTGVSDIFSRIDINDETGNLVGGWKYAPGEKDAIIQFKNGTFRNSPKKTFRITAELKSGVLPATKGSLGFNLGWPPSLLQIPYRIDVQSNGNQPQRGRKGAPGAVGG